MRNNRKNWEMFVASRSEKTAIIRKRLLVQRRREQLPTNAYFLQPNFHSFTLQNNLSQYKQEKRKKTLTIQQLLLFLY